MAPSKISETDLYAPVKTMLEGQGYVVKSEIGAADIVACRDDEEPVIVELKTGFTLTLFHQAVARQAVSDTIYITVPHKSGVQFAKSLANNIKLCRRLGLGLLTVRMKSGKVVAHLDPAPYQPRVSKPRRGRLLKEFMKRVGDPNTGGATRKGLMTAYRQDALRCLAVLQSRGATKASEVSRLSGVEKARRLMSDDHYGWFERVETGVYAVTPKGKDALDLYADELVRLVTSDDDA